MIARMLQHMVDAKQQTLERLLRAGMWSILEDWLQHEKARNAPKTIITLLLTLKDLPVNLSLLSTNSIPKLVRRCTKSEDPKISSIAKAIVNKWKGIVKTETTTAKQPPTATPTAKPAANRAAAAKRTTTTTSHSSDHGDENPTKVARVHAQHRRHQQPQQQPQQQQTKPLSDDELRATGRVILTGTSSKTEPVTKPAASVPSARGYTATRLKPSARGGVTFLRSSGTRGKTIVKTEGAEQQQQQQQQAKARTAATSATSPTSASRRLLLSMSRQRRNSRSRSSSQSDKPDSDATATATAAATNTSSATPAPTSSSASGLGHASVPTAPASPGLSTAASSAASSMAASPVRQPADHHDHGMDMDMGMGTGDDGDVDVFAQSSTTQLKPPPTTSSSSSSSSNAVSPPRSTAQQQQQQQQQHNMATKKKKRVRWNPKLTAVRYYDLHEDERTSKQAHFRDLARGEHQGESEAVANLRQQHRIEPAVAWHAPRRLCVRLTDDDNQEMLAPERGKDSTEKAEQERRCRLTLPPTTQAASPAEPDEASDAEEHDLHHDCKPIPLEQPQPQPQPQPQEQEAHQEAQPDQYQPYQQPSESQQDNDM